MHPRSGHVPPLLRPDEMPPIVDQASLEHSLRALVGHPRFGWPQVWLLEIRDGLAGQLIVIDDAPLEPAPESTAPLGEVAKALADAGGSCALMYARPGSAARTPGDEAWGRALAALGSDWPVHLANDEEVRVVAPDDLAPPSR